VNGSLTFAIGSRKNSALQHSSGLRFSAASSGNNRSDFPADAAPADKNSLRPRNRKCAASNRQSKS
jgi:hypothetical protein